jgi:hypothetical protein
MTADLDKLRARALKLAAMANDARGSAAEAETARRMLEKALATLGITEADLTGEDKPAPRTFKVADTLALDLLVQVLCKVLDTGGIEFNRGNKSRTIALTNAQHVEAQMLLSVMGPAMRRHMEASFAAFILANKLHSSGRHDDDSRPAPTPEEIERMQAAKNLALMTKPTPVHTQIGAAQ